MDRDIKYLIIPDVHGRDFWKTPVEETLLNSDGRVIFLGDYLDPYAYEWRDRGADFDYYQHALDGFKQILEIKDQDPERVTLLIGNHDCGYALGDDICRDRMDRVHRHEIEELFQDNWQKFRLAEECTLGDRHFIFSHAGIHRGWADRVWGEEELSSGNFNVVDNLNNAWLVSHYGILNALGMYDSYRGYLGYKYGSPVWSDIRSWTRVTPEETFGFNICGHTQCEVPVVLDQIADLDCRKAFYLNTSGDICDWETGEILKKTRRDEDQ